mmetsp:Transcript_4660/g.7017  ORF Transcript_4660/g.7017 Transcript_4660/m.7017 type:complete len:364 (-) Transcript_4660:26-1117(-)
MEEPAVVDLKPFLSYLEENPDYSQLSPELLEECTKVVDSFHHTGVLVIRDPRVNENDNWNFIDMMERYYERAGTQFYNGEKVAEVHPELHFQAGATPEGQERARNHCTRMQALPEGDKAISECPPQFDAKWRYFWRIGEFADSESDYEFNNVSPEDFPEWSQIMNRWGGLILEGIKTVVRMWEAGAGIQPGKVLDMMRGAPHLLAPTGSDLNKYQKGTVFAGYHYDLNFITIHGKSRFPGLSVWTRNNKKISVSVPDGCLLLQAGKQFENLTGGYVMAGFHEVVYNDATEAAVERAKTESRSLWRISSTLFGHLRYDVSLEPMIEFEGKYEGTRDQVLEKYPPMTAGELVKEELKQINLWNGN